MKALLVIGFGTALLAACGSLPTGSAQAGLEGSTNLKVRPNVYNVIYSFAQSNDARHPIAGLVDVSGTFYGTSYYGGLTNRSSDCGGATHPGCGTVYTITPAGSESVLYAFKGNTTGDGLYPYAGVVDVGDKVFGTTLNGGTSTNCPVGCGTVFSVTRLGKEAVLHSFAGELSNDGSSPMGRLLNVNGTLYGTTMAGGKSNDGTVFSITQSGKETVLHSFTGGSDGSAPYSGLINLGGTFYGTTEGGGANKVGTVYSINPSGNEAVIYSFKGGAADGAFPEGSLIDVHGTLYGTTSSGGSGTGCECGTVFSVSLSGSEHVIYSFGKVDGAGPSAGLTAIGGAFYGTTSSYSEFHRGEVFELSHAGALNVLHAFGGEPDGSDSLGQLLAVNGTLYGTTYNGGSGKFGTVFAVKP